MKTTIKKGKADDLGATIPLKTQQTMPPAKAKAERKNSSLGSKDACPPANKKNDAGMNADNLSTYNMNGKIDFN